MSKTFDCCMVFNELDMLDLRFNILRDVVDYFVVVESGTTHSGNPKPRYFGDALAAGRFAEFEDRIVYAYSPELSGANSWEREHNHRALISDVLRDLAQPEDWVIVGDADEIPDPDAVFGIKQGVIEQDKFALEMELHYYDFHHLVRQGWAIGMMKWKVEQDANLIRAFNTHAPLTHVTNGGWHLSYFMTPEQVVAKLNAFMHHADVAKDVPRDADWIADKMRKGLDLYGRPLEIVEVDPEPYLPQYVKDHRDKYEALGWLKSERVTI